MTRPARITLLAGTWALAVILLWLAGRGVDWRQTSVAVRSARVPWLVVAIASNLVILLLWAALWRLVLPRGVGIAYRRMFGIVSVTSAIMNTIPALVGHASAVALLVTRGGMPVRTAGSVIALDQVAEGLSKLAVIALALALVDLPDWFAAAAVPVAAAVAALLVLVLAFAHMGHGRIETRLGRFVSGLRADFHLLHSPARAARALVIAFLMKAAEAAGIACVIVALGIDVPLSASFAVLGAVNLATMVPVSPGNIGTYEIGAVAVYRWLGVPPEAALAAAIVQHLCFLLPAVGSGAVWIAASGTVHGAGVRSAG